MSRAGTVRRSMTANITGRSMTREELMPMMVEFCGMLKGDTVMDMPLTSTRLNTLAPITLPSEREPWPFASEVIAVTSSGREVPSATKVRAMTDSGTPSACAIRVPLSTSRFAPTAIRAAPRMSRPISLAKDISFSGSSSSSSGAGAFFIANTLQTM